MKRRKFINAAALSSMGIWLHKNVKTYKNQSGVGSKSIGIIGLDTSHALAFTKIINAPSPEMDPGLRITQAYPHGSLDIESSTSRIPRYTEEIQQYGVMISDSLDALLDKVDLVLLETNDGRRHLEQAIPIFKAGKPVFIDKPIAASLSDVLAIVEASRKYQVPMFSASSLRFAPSTQAIASGDKIGKILGAETFSPATIEKTHPDLFWYGVHGVESLFTIMGAGCKQVRRIFREDMDLVIGEWGDGRIGSFRGIRGGKKDYGGTAFGETGIAPVGKYEGYEHLVEEILTFFRSGKVPFPVEETVEIFAFMEAAEESKRRGGDLVTLKEVIDKAKY